MIRDSWRIVRLGLKSLMLHKLRSSLTTAGILFGVASVIAMLAVGEGAKKAALDRFRDMGVTNLIARSKKPAETQSSSSQSSWSALAYGLLYAEADLIASSLPSAEVARIREVKRPMMRGEYFHTSIVVGTEPSFLRIANMKVREGRWLSAVDDERLANVCVLGETLSQLLFPLSNPMDQTVLVGGDDRYRVVGILDGQGRTAGAGSTPYDECMFVPLKTHRRRFGDEVTTRSGGSFSRERVELHEIKVKMPASEEVSAGAQILRDLLEAQHKANNDVLVTVPLELLKQEEDSKRMFNIVLAVIASISLLVGGIGIMNVMLATVTERTREIGIRRALGAKKKHIIQQFLVESGVLSALGGVVGVGLGIGLPFLITLWFDQETIILPQHVALAFGISAAVGVVFGIYPAWRAANMDPVEALRHE
ncbi:MAG: ABC transporter permease [Planctomycetes bacterium]|nr:ABC transporter permease [Planctomycetota bacterium]